MQSTFVRYIYKVIVFVAGDWQKEMVRKRWGGLGGQGFFLMYVGGLGCLKSC